MEADKLVDRISRGRTDLVFELLGRPDRNVLLAAGPVTVLQWFVYYNDVTALRAVLAAGETLGPIDLDRELGNAAFFGHWKVCDFLIENGANPRYADPETGETPLHGALAKAGRPYYLYVVRLLVERGADVNARTIPGVETGAFMRDVRTKGETPLHRAAAYSDAETIRFLIANGADRTAADAFGQTPIGWASEHLRTGEILSLLAWGDFRIGEAARERIRSDHGAGWGNGMEWNILGDYLPGSVEEA